MGDSPFLRRADATYCARTVDLVQNSTVIDMLGLLTLDYENFRVGGRILRGSGNADFLRLQRSGINVFHPAVGYTSGDIYGESLRDITRWNTFIKARPAQFLRVEKAADFERTKVLGKLGIVIGQQNSEHFRTVDDVDRFYALGQRVSQLTYRGNRIGGGSSDARDSGLTDYGAAIISRMNHIGMAVDISHCADRTTLDAIEASDESGTDDPFKLPEVWSNCARCKTDEAIRRWRERAG